MGDVLFYHLTRSTLEATLAALLPRALGRGWRVAVRGTDADRLARLDERLWEGDGFLPHGLAGGPQDARQPVLLTTGGAEGRECLFAVDGAEIADAEVAGLARACLVFDGGDAAAVAAARTAWRRMTAAGHPAQYWAEGADGWVKKAVHPPE